MRLGLMLAACHGPSLTPAHVARAAKIAEDAGVHSIAWTEAYNQIPALRHQRGWELVVGVSATDKRRGPKDNPLMLRRAHTRVHESGAFKACRATRPRRLAPERWVTWAVYETEPGGLLVLDVAIHPNPAVQHARPIAARRRAHLRQMCKVERLVGRMRRKYGHDLHPVIRGDVNSTADWDAKYASAAVFERLKLRTYWHGICAIAYDHRLKRGPVHVIRDNGQDHPWFVLHLEERK